MGFYSTDGISVVSTVKAPEWCMEGSAILPLPFVSVPTWIQPRETSFTIGYGVLGKARGVSIFQRESGKE